MDQDPKRSTVRVSADHTAHVHARYKRATIDERAVASCGELRRAAAANCGELRRAAASCGDAQGQEKVGSSPYVAKYQNRSLRYSIGPQLEVLTVDNPTPRLVDWSSKECAGHPFFGFSHSSLNKSGKPRVHAPLAMPPQGARGTLGKPPIFTSDPSAVTEGKKPSQGGLSLHKHKHTKRPTRTPARAALPIPPPPVRPSGLLPKSPRPHRIHSNLARPLPRHAPTAAWVGAA